jgi:hypothetical protein
MNRADKIKQFKKIESALEQKYKGKRENEVSLEKTDFKDGKLSVSGYTWLKQQCEYMGHKEDIEIRVPKEYAESFMDMLEYLAANELSCIKKDRRNIKITALGLLVTGVLWYLVRCYFAHAIVIQEITLVATWVFVWSAVEKWFFDQNHLANRRHRLLQILCAKITEQI